MTSPWVTLNGRDECDFEKIDDHNNLGNVKRLMQIKQMGFSTTNISKFNNIGSLGSKDVEVEKFEFNIGEIGSLGSEESSYDEDDESPEIQNNRSPRTKKPVIKQRSLPYSKQEA